jgi:hypothetical protein
VADSLVVGVQGNYQWLVAKHSFDDLIERCPEILLGKFLAITAFDSGPLLLNDEEKAAGWESRGEIAYSPKIADMENLPYDNRYDEWYVFDAPTDLGQLADQNTNIFERSPSRREVSVFVNFNLNLDLPSMRPLIELYWKQLDWICPRTYIAKSECCLTIVSSYKKEFESICKALNELDCASKVL